MNRLVARSLCAGLAFSASPSYAWGTSLDAASSEDPSEVVVTGERVQYGIRATSTATKTSTDVKDIPQALTTVTKQQIDDQQLRSVGDLLLYVPGASYGSGEGNRDQLVLRGNSSTADFFVDGVRDDVQYFRDFYNVERVEVLKGPNAMIFGRGGGGGIINRQLKRPTFNSDEQFTASADSWSGLRLTGDVDQPLGHSAAIRLNGVYEDGGSFRSNVDRKLYGINPTAALQLGSDTRIDLSYEYFHDRRTADRGVPANGDEPILGFTRTFFGDPNQSFERADVNVATLAIDHRFGPELTLHNRTLFGDYRKFYQNVFPAGFNPAINLVSFSAYNNLNNRRNRFSQTDLVWNNRLAGTDQTLLIGFEVGREKSRNKHLTGSFPNGSTAPISDPTVAAEVIYAPIASDANNRVEAKVAALYAQDQIKPASWLEIVAGLRFDRFKLSLEDLRPVGGGLFTRTDHLFSPRFGLVLKPADKLSFYASYSRSYLPQSGDQFSSLSPITAQLKPERFDNYEVGAKWEVLSGLLATAAIYRLDRSNTRATDPNDPSQTVLTGRQRSRGIEVGLERSITSRWMISAGYTLQKAGITETTTAAPKGNQVPLVPRRSFSLWNRYDVTHDLGLGFGFIARSKSYATISNTVKLPGYARLDAAMFYKLPHGVDAQLNVENLLGAHYFPTANADNNIIPGAPRTIKVLIGYRI
jgi:catecholate siderophore receptor